MRIFIAAQQLCWPNLDIIFWCCHLFLFRRLISDVARLIVTKLYQVWRWPRFIKFGHKFGNTPPKKLADHSIKIWVISQVDRKYLRTATRYHQTYNVVVNCEHSHTCVLNMMNFGLQTAKTRTEVSTHPTGGQSSLWALPGILVKH